MDDAVRVRVERLGLELQKILQENLLRDPSLTDEPMAKARAIRDEIQMMGFMVQWESTLDPRTLTIKVDVSLFEPRRDLSPKDQKIYDEWFAKVNKIEPPQ